MSARDGLILRFSTDLLPAQRSIGEFALNSVSMLASVGRKAIESEASLQTLSRATSALTIGAGVFAGFEALKIAFEVTTAAAKAAEEEIGRLVKIADEARGVGVGTTFFQQFTEGSKKLGLEAEDLTAILEKLRDASKVSLGTGDDEADPQSAAQKAIKAEIDAGNLREGDDRSFNSAGSQEARLRAALSLIDELQKKGAQLAAFDLGNKLFGEGFETKLRSDTNLVASLQQRLDDMANGRGANVIPPEQLAAAKEMQATIESLNQRIQDALIPFHSDLRAWQQSELESTLQLKEYWVEIVEVFGRLWKFCDDIGKTISGWGSGGVFRELSGLLDKLGMLKEGDGFHTFRDKAGNPTNLAEARRQGTEAPAPDSAPPLTITRPRGDTSRPLKSDDKPEHSHEEKDAVEEYINTIRKEAVAEGAKAATLGMSNQAQREALDLAKGREIASEHGRSLTAAETESIKQQADAYAAAETKINQFTKAQEDAKARAEFLGDQVASSVEKMAIGGGRLRDVMLDVVRALEQAAIKALILGQGPLAGLFGMSSGGVNGEGKGFGGLGGLLGLATGAFKSSTDGAEAGASGGLLGKLFAGFYADGGSIPSGMFGIAGERGPEIIHGPATVTPQAAIDRAMSNAGGNGGTTQFNHAPTYNIMPAGGVTPEQLTAAINRSHRELTANIIPIFSKARARS